jgi:hypothetical protein
MKIPNNKLFCFSPPVMVATFALELTFALYVVWRYKLTAITRLVAVLLLFLATFQLAEYMICGGFGISGDMWSRVGYIAITMLPALGFHLTTVLANKHLPWLIGSAYAGAIAFAVFFAVMAHAIISQVCQGNYVIFSIAPGSLFIYILYYYGWIAMIVGMGFRWAKRQKEQKRQRALKAMAVGMLAFLLPTATINILDPATMVAIPSIMCGFAILFAIALVFWVAPASRKA